MSRPILLEPCAGEGGSTRGFMDAGWDVIAVDSDANRLKHNPARWKIVGDALAILDELARTGFVMVDSEALRPGATHAGWPCQGYSAGTRALRAGGGTSKHRRLIAVGREAQRATGLPYVIENVAGAKSELINPILLCGRQFGLSAIDDDGTPLVMDRHRLFESDVLLMAPPHRPHDRTVQVAGSYGGARRDKTEAREIRHGGYVPSEAVQAKLLGIDWMTPTGMRLSIPPVYGRFIGEQLLAHVMEAAA